MNLQLASLSRSPVHAVAFWIAVSAPMMFCPKVAFAEKLEDSLSSYQIAVEKVTGRGGDNEFSGWVGSLRFDSDLRIISISEFSNIVDKVIVLNGVYRITYLRKSKNNIDFECVDVNVGTAGIEWRGKVWLTDDNRLKIEMSHKQSPRKWVNIGTAGGQFLASNNLKLNLGM